MLQFLTEEVGEKLMTLREVMLEVKHLSLEDRLLLLDLLTQTLRQESDPGKRSTSSLSRLRGLLKSGDSQATDAELADIYSTHLLEKYT